MEILVTDTENWYVCVFKQEGSLCGFRWIYCIFFRRMYMNRYEICVRELLGRRRCKYMPLTRADGITNRWRYFQKYITVMYSSIESSVSWRAHTTLQCFLRIFFRITQFPSSFPISLSLFRPVYLLRDSGGRFAQWPPKPPKGWLPR